MKKFLILAIALVCFMTGNTLMAAYQYQDIIGLNGNSMYAMGSYDNVTLNFISNISNWATLTIEATDALGNVTSNTVNITGQAVNIGSISAGSDLKFYLTNNSPTQGTADINWKGWGSDWDVAADTYEYLHFGANYGKWGSQYVTTTFKVDGTPAPTGQPLPGALAALLVGGAGAGAFAIRRKKTAAAK